MLRLRCPTLTAAALAAALIVAINPVHARGQAAPNCTPRSPLLERVEPTVPPKPVPNVAFQDAQGAEPTIADFAGSGVVLNFWATWCAPCVHEMPALDALKADLEEAGIEVLAVSEDTTGMKSIKQFYKVNGIENLEMLHDPDGKLAHALGVHALPTTLLIDDQGREVARIVGAAPYGEDDMRTFIENCVGG